jgi:hypothetical protein
VVLGCEDRTGLRRGVGIEIVFVGKAVIHRRNDFQFLQHDLDGLLLCKRRITLATGVGVERQRFLQVSGNASVLPSADFQCINRVYPAEIDPALASNPSEITVNALVVNRLGIVAF